ncbi:hypothetical protein FKP32DRAFT_1600223 [Trametes sanguinea]|nr:hypothetical protein FKP32DRAFT_1600223 [Trametes sanguinea]
MAHPTPPALSPAMTTSRTIPPDSEGHLMPVSSRFAARRGGTPGSPDALSDSGFEGEGADTALGGPPGSPDALPTSGFKGEGADTALGGPPGSPDALPTSGFKGEGADTAPGGPPGFPDARVASESISEGENSAIGASPMQLLRPPYMTSANFLLDVLSTRITVKVVSRENDTLEPMMTIHPRDLRALYMKALVWFFDRECVRTIDSYVVYAGRDPAQPLDNYVAAVPLDEVRRIACELPDSYVDDAAIDDFDSFMFHAGQYYDQRSLSFTLLFITLLIVSLILCIVYIVAEVIVM